MPHVSVVISTHNRSALLRQSLASALGQRDIDLEVIVVDNGSTDDTAAVLEQLDDSRLRVLRNAVSTGPTKGRNAGLAAARGEWVGLLDDDDLWAPTKLREQLDAAEAGGRSWVYAGCVFIDRRTRIIGGRPPLRPDTMVEELPVRYTIPGGIANVVWRRDALDGDGLLDERVLLMADWDLALRLLRASPPAWVRRPLVAYRQTGANISRHAARYQDELQLVAEKFADLRDGRPLDFGAQKRFAGSQALHAGARAEALRYYAAGARLGDWGSVWRAGGVLFPVRAQPSLRRWLLSDRRWIADAASWVEAAGAPR